MGEETPPTTEEIRAFESDRKRHVRLAVLRLQERTGDPKIEARLALTILKLRKEIRDEPDKEKRQQLVREFGFSIPELDGFLKQYEQRLKAVMTEGRNPQALSAAIEKEHKARDARDLHQRALRGTALFGAKSSGGHT